jgi:hypothetical protein
MEKAAQIFALVKCFSLSVQKFFMLITAGAIVLIATPPSNFLDDLPTNRS